MDNLNKLTFTQLKETSEVIDFIEELISNSNQYGSSIKVIEKNKEDLVIKIISSDPLSTYHFTVHQGKLINSKNNFKVTVSPSNANDNKEVEVFKISEATKGLFKWWANLAEEFNAIKSKMTNDPFLQANTDDYYSRYQSVLVDDIDADTKPFNIEIQKYLHLYLDFVVKKLEDSEEDVTELIEEIGNVQANIHKSSKNDVIMGIAKIAAKIHAKGIAFLNKYWSGVKEEAFKQIIKGSINEVKDAVQESAIPIALVIKNAFPNLPL